MEKKQLMLVQEHQHEVKVIESDLYAALPDLFLSVWIECPDDFERDRWNELFALTSCHKAESVKEADLVLFGGGADVDPALYGEEPHKTTHVDSERDKSDIALWATCYEEGIPVVGICRGAQFGHVMMGGRLWQDIDNHQSAHRMYDVIGKRTMVVSSVHHQSVISNNAMDVVGSSCVSSVRETGNGDRTTGTANDIEAFFYPEASFFGVQGHPEYQGYNEYTVWFFETLRELIVHNPDVVVDDGFYRIKPEVRALREKVGVE
jgi:putative glutamine amidotransferase